MSKPLSVLLGALKALAAAVVPLVSVALVSNSFDWRAILAAAIGAVAVYFIPNLNVPTSKPSSPVTHSAPISPAGPPPAAKS